MKRITKIEVEKECRRKLRVAAYARVSTASDEQLVSLEPRRTITSDTLKHGRTGNSLGFIMTKA